MASLLRKNVFANYLGQGWSALMGFAFLPLYLQLLGAEAYGLVGLFALLFAWMALLDLGMTPLLSRDMARFRANTINKGQVVDLFRSVECFVVVLSAAFSLTLLACSGLIANRWLQLESLSIEQVSAAISVMALVLALRFVENVYRSSLYGLQLQVWLNAVGAGLDTLRHAGAVVVLVFVARDIESFFWWQGGISVLSVCILAWRVRRALPRIDRPAKISLASLRDSKGFAAGMFVITLLSILLSQLDKVVLAKVLSLSDFGYYSFAATVAALLYRASNPVIQAVYPQLVELVSKGETREVSRLYHRSCQLFAVLVSAPVVLFAFYADELILLWSGNSELAEGAGLVLSLLVLGNFFNVTMALPYHLQLANAWTSLTVRVNLVALVLLGPAMLWASLHHGGAGAAFVWMTLNAMYVLFVVPLVHRRLLPGHSFRWYVHDFLAPLLASVSVVLGSRLLANSIDLGRLGWFALLAATGIFAFLASCLASPELRNMLAERKAKQTS